MSITTIHSDGPWRVQGFAILANHPCDGSVRGANDTSFYDGSYLIAESVSKNNQPLIVEAPELLALSMSILEAVTQGTGTLDHSMVLRLEQSVARATTRL